MAYDRDKTFNDLAAEVGQLGNTLRRAIIEAAARYSDWQTFKAGRFPSQTLTQIAVALGRVIPGTAQAGGASAITLEAADGMEDDYYNGHVIRITGGTGAGQERSITDYVKSTKVATVDSAWTTDPDNTSTYALQIDLELLEAAYTDGYELYTLANGDATLGSVKNHLIDIIKFT